MPRLLRTITVVLLFAACGGDDNATPEPETTTTATDTTTETTDTTGETTDTTAAPDDSGSTESACRASFQAYADALAADPLVDEAPLQAATVNACGSSDEWIEIAEEFQGPDDLFPPNPIGGMENVLALFCEDAAGPACP